MINDTMLTNDKRYDIGKNSKMEFKREAHSCCTEAVPQVKVQWNIAAIAMVFAP
jgi:hypothetical protein